MTVSQKLNHVNDNNYDDDIAITDVPKGYFPAVTECTIAEGASTRQISVLLFPLEQSTGGTMPVNSGLYVRIESEQSVHVTVKNEGGATLGENTQAYS